MAGLFFSQEIEKAPTGKHSASESAPLGKKKARHGCAQLLTIVLYHIGIRSGQLSGSSPAGTERVRRSGIDLWGNPSVLYGLFQRLIVLAEIRQDIR